MPTWRFIGHWQPATPILAFPIIHVLLGHILPRFRTRFYISATNAPGHSWFSIALFPSKHTSSTHYLWTPDLATGPFTLDLSSKSGPSLLRGSGKSCILPALPRAYSGLYLLSHLPLPFLCLASLLLNITAAVRYPIYYDVSDGHNGRDCNSHSQGFHALQWRSNLLSRI